MYNLTINLSELQGEGEKKIPLIPEKYKNDPKKHGYMNFRYHSNVPVQREEKANAKPIENNV